MSDNTPRIQIVDVIRGIALLGILIFNIQTYALFAFLEPAQVFQMKLDRPELYDPLQFILHVLVNGQFYTIYSFLFGLGFYLLTHNRGMQGIRLFKARLWILLVIGLIHGFVFWFGDILHKYALLGFTLIFFNKKSTKSLIKWIAGIMLFSIVLQIILTLLTSAAPVAADTNPIDPLIMQVLNTWQHGSWIEVTAMQKLGVAMLWYMSVINGLAGIAHYLVMFILGLLAGRTGFFKNIELLKPAIVKTLVILFPIALFIKMFAHLNLLKRSILAETSPEFQKIVFSLSNFVGVPLLTICYLLLLSLVLHKNSSFIFRWIGNTGKLGLTNYLMQTLLCSLLFYGYAVGFSGKLTLAETLLFVLPIYILQVIFSNIWIKYKTSGPVESLWRNLSRRLISKNISKSSK